MTDAPCTLCRVLTRSDCLHCADDYGLAQRGWVCGVCLDDLRHDAREVEAERQWERDHAHDEWSVQWLG